MTRLMLLAAAGTAFTLAGPAGEARADHWRSGGSFSGHRSSYYSPGLSGYSRYSPGLSGYSSGYSSYGRSWGGHDHGWGGSGYRGFGHGGHGHYGHGHHDYGHGHYGHGRYGHRGSQKGFGIYFGDGGLGISYFRHRR